MHWGCKEALPTREKMCFPRGVLLDEYMIKKLKKPKIHKGCSR
jgi:hypothetical protein